jgi:hypothetical protein
MFDTNTTTTATLIRPLTPPGQPPSPTQPATIVDITPDTIALRLDHDASITPNQLIELTIDGHWSRGRILWSRQGIRNTVIAYVEVA